MWTSRVAKTCITSSTAKFSDLSKLTQVQPHFGLTLVDSLSRFLVNLNSEYTWPSLILFLFLSFLISTVSPISNLHSATAEILFTFTFCEYFHFMLLYTLYYSEGSVRFTLQTLITNTKLINK